jgi:uncharacterized protein (TIGR02594 family)
MMPLKLGARGAAVRKLQLSLDTHLPRHLHIRPDGEFGPATERALIAFQRHRKLSPDGVAGARTLLALGFAAHAHVEVPDVLAQSLLQRAPWIAIAAAEFGVHRDLVAHHDRRIIEYLKTTTVPDAMAGTDSTAWCSAFVNWVMIKSGRKGTNNAGAVSWLKWKHGSLSSTPTPGAIVVIKKAGVSSDQFTGSSTGHHVGFCVASSSHSVRLLGGNQGSRVSFASFSLSTWTLKGAVWPTP